MVFIFGPSKLLDFKSGKWRFLHNVAKPMIEAVVTAVYKECEDIIKSKEIKGWQYPEIQKLYECWGEAIQKDIDAGIFKSPEEWDHIRDFLTKLRAIVCCQLDEDSHFTLRAFFFLDILFREEENFNIEFHKRRAYWDENAWRDLLRKVAGDDPRWKEYLEKHSKNSCGSGATASRVAGSPAGSTS